MASASDIAKMRKNIADGHKPQCPVCGSDLHISNPTEGNTGSKGYNYSCTKTEDPNCSLKSGFIKIPWYAVVLQFATKQLALLGIVIFTALGGGLTYLVNTLNPENKEDTEQIGSKVNRNNTTELSTLKETITKKDAEISQLKAELNELKSKPASTLTDDDQKLILEAQRRIGIEEATKYRDRSKKYLLNVLDGYIKMDGKYPLTDDQKSAIMEVLAGHIVADKLNMDELQQFESYVVKNKFSGFGRKHEHLGHTYYYLASATGEGSKGFYDFRLKSLYNYLKFVHNLKTAKPSPGVISSMDLAFRSVYGKDVLPNSMDKKKVRNFFSQLVSKPEMNFQDYQPDLHEYIAALESKINTSNE